MIAVEKGVYHNFNEKSKMTKVQPPQKVQNEQSLNQRQNQNLSNTLNEWKNYCYVPDIDQALSYVKYGG